MRVIANVPRLPCVPGGEYIVTDMDEEHGKRAAHAMAFPGG
jgi:hypothetical protein